MLGFGDREVSVVGFENFQSSLLHILKSRAGA
jgi:hypothetical protein